MRLVFPTLWLRDGGELRRHAPVIEDEDAAWRRRHGRIRCPLCGWQPSRGDRWVCGLRLGPFVVLGCGHVWNTFDTRGRCPACGKQWTVTACHACHRLSPHEDWYERGGDEPPR